MSRHRNVRTMNYDDDYEGYDDVYGHSVEDDYCVSPSVSQFMYDRSRGTQVSHFFAEENNITEEPEEEGNTSSKDVERTRQRLDSLTIDSAVAEAIADLVPEEEMLLKSCVDEIHDVVGESFPDNVIISHILNAKFNREKALDSLLSGKNVDLTSLSPALAAQLPKKLKSQEPLPAVVKPQPVKPKEPVSKDHNNLLANGLSFNGLSKNGLALEKTIITAGSVLGTPPMRSTVKPEDSPTSPVSLLASIASDHLKKKNGVNFLDLSCANGSSTKIGAACSNPLMAMVGGMPKNGEKSEVLLGISPNTIKNPLLMASNPLLSLSSKPGTKSESVAQSKPINIPSVLSAFPGVGLGSPNANPLKAAMGLENVDSSLTREHSPSSMLKNPLLGSGCNKPIGGFCSNPLLTTQNPLAMLSPKLPLLPPSNNGVVTTDANPLLSMKPLLPIPNMLENMTKPIGLNNNTIFSSSPKNPLTLAASPPKPLPPKNQPKPSQLPPARFKPKPKPDYEFGIVETRRQRQTESISTYPVPFNESLFDKSLVKEKPSVLGARFVRRSVPTTVMDENSIPLHKRVWTLMAEIVPEKLFKFDTPSPDAMVGNVIDFVGMRPNTTEELLKNAAIVETNSEDMDTTGPQDFSLGPPIETKAFPSSEAKGRSGPVKREKKKAAPSNNNNNNNNIKVKKSRPKPSEKTRSKKK